MGNWVRKQDLKRIEVSFVFFFFLVLFSPSFFALSTGKFVLLFSTLSSGRVWMMKKSNIPTRKILYNGLYLFCISTNCIIIIPIRYFFSNTEVISVCLQVRIVCLFCFVIISPLPQLFFSTFHPLIFSFVFSFSVHLNGE